MNCAKNLLMASMAFISAALSAAVFMGCSLDSGESSSRRVNLIVQGFYSGSSGPLVQNNTGSPISTMDLRQSGDGLEGVDNNGIIFKGSIGRVDDETQQASFTLRGATTVGMQGTMAGVIDVNGTSATMQGTWAEPTLFSTFSGTATVPQTPENSTGGGGNVSITSGGGTLTVGVASSFSASESVTWSSNIAGTFSPTTGSSTQFTPSLTGSGTVTATSGSDSDSVNISVTN